ncbi:alpha/beta hydrolase-fold protein [Planctomicrobium piriforme]|uniref:Putative esterase n=1 Tax=Planctomicrobium piriforme TaxID=1576369 RepID=A0A1I3FDJ8_9PLAN|nr:alpha/beta hydrolase-fold protein [Planctomicrobium piriforme]SFI09267.1 Putative esterase [Planctomicrobium piriforme]
MARVTLWCLTFSLLACTCLWADEAVVISPTRQDGNGFLVHDVRSPYESGVTQIRVLLPDEIKPGQKYPVVYVLPVEAGAENHYGDGLTEIKQLGLHNRFPAIYVAPTFSHLPWYADHPTNPEIRQETYFLKVVVPFIDSTYPVLPEKRLLLGFSKSGWGAWSLLLRHPDLFAKAAAWDAPVMMDQPGKYGSGDIFGTKENFQGYQVSALLEHNAGQFQSGKRLILVGYGNFELEHQQAHALLNKLQISHEFRDGPARRHDWHSGWVTEAIELLFSE